MVNPTHSIVNWKMTKKIKGISKPKLSKIPHPQKKSIAGRKMDDSHAVGRVRSNKFRHSKK